MNPGSMIQVDPQAEPFTSEGRPDASGRTVGVLLSHGFTGSPYSMRPWGQALAAEGYAVSVPRLPGHGTTWQEMNTTTFDDWYDAIERAYDDLRRRCDVVVVGGLSMGGTLVLELTARHPEIAGVVLVNPAANLTDKRLLALPVLKHLVGGFPGIGNDIKKPGIEEHGYDKTPLKALHSQVKAWKRLRTTLLPKITCPVLLYRSAEDHVLDPTSARIILGGISSRDVEEVVLHDSYHVATLDNDAPQIFDGSLEFIRKVTAQ